jgi:hypothetical protein
MSHKSFVSVYFTYFHAVLSYGIIFWGNSPRSIGIFRPQKTVVRTVSGIKGRDTCREYFRELQILPLLSQYIFSILMFVAKNTNYYTFYSDIHSINIRHTFDLDQPSSSLTIFNKGVFDMSIKIFNNLPLKIKVLLHDTERFKRWLKILLYSNSFYTLQEYFNYQCQSLVLLDILFSLLLYMYNHVFTCIYVPCHICSVKKISTIRSYVKEQLLTNNSL